MAKGPRKRLTDIATRHQVFLERFKEGEAINFARAFDAVNVATRDVLASLQVATVNELSKTKLNAALKDLRALNLEILTAAQGDLFSTLDKLAGSEAAFEARTFGALRASVRLGMPQAGDIFADALAKPLSVNGQLLKTFVGNWGAAEVDRVNDTVRRAWSEGWTVNRLTTAINGTKKLNYSDGIIGVPGSSAAVARRNARAVARTAVQHVASAGRMAFWEANADYITGYRFVATLDSRTTQICRSLDGNVYELNAGPVPPVHVGCRSTTVAETDPALDFLDEGATRSSENGYVDANQTYYDWLKDQPADFQDEAIGKTRAKLFRDGGLSVEDFSQLNIGRNFQPLTLAEMQKLEPLAFAKAGIPPKQ